MPRRRRKKWLLPILFLMGLAVALSGLLYALDRHRAGLGDPLAYFKFAPERITDAVGSLSSTIAAVLGR